MSIEIDEILCCHRSTHCAAVSAIKVHISRTNEQLKANFALEGDTSQICLMPPRGPQRLVQLWRHTCFELFIAIENQAAYHEFNFAPWGEWRVHSFSSYRTLDPTMSKIQPAPSIALQTTGGRLELAVRIKLAELSELHPNNALSLGASAVIEAKDGSLSYWALRHPAPKPDFHDREGFALRMEPPLCAMPRS
jgi:hypothetical protein